MGFLDNTSITVDAVLTKKGRELLAKGQNQFNITKFALADDDVDYRLWDVTHPMALIIMELSLKICLLQKHSLTIITL